MIQKHLEYIKNEISKIYKQIHVIIEEIKETNEYYILIDSEAVYETNEFQELIMNFCINYLWKNNIFNVYFSFDESKNMLLL